ncbi:hypothetical protein [Acetivibrio saccincola]|uniref:hypothetical protein n=1 Tax=Acetivibrio saccincola TaxID=1677857 RepID=UPI001FA88881|nr:hypothetical protein [Acetivibrio saccincola]
MKKINSINKVIGNVFKINKIGDLINLQTITREKTEEICTPTIDMAKDKATTKRMLM